MKYKLLSAILILGIVLFAVYKYAYQDHRDIASEKPAFEITSSALIEEFTIDAASATEKFLNKTVQLSGICTGANATTITLNDRVFFTMENNENYKKLINKEIVVKGRCIGYDDLLEEVKFDQTSIINK